MDASNEKGAGTAIPAPDDANNVDSNASAGTQIPCIVLGDSPSTGLAIQVLGRWANYYVSGVEVTREIFLDALALIAAGGRLT